MIMLWAARSMTGMPSLPNAVEPASTAGLESFGAVYGAYNVACGIGLPGRPALGGLLVKRAGFDALRSSRHRCW